MIPRILVGTLLTISGMVFMVASGFILAHTFNTHETEIAQVHNIARACQKGASRFGEARLRGDNSVSVDLGQFADVRAVYDRMTEVLAVCPYSQLVSACIGTGCQQPNTALPRANMVLSAPEFSDETKTAPATTKSIKPISKKPLQKATK